MKIQKQEVSKEERRRFPRVAKRVRVRARVVDGSAADIAAETVDLSMGGVCIQTEKTVPMGTQLRLTFEGVAPHLAFEVRGRVSWCTPAKAGEHFDSGVDLLGLTRAKLEKLLALVCDEGWDAGASGDRRYIHLQRHLIVAHRRTGAWLNRSRQHAYTEDISLRGMSIHFEKPVDADAKLSMHLLLPDGQPEPLECFGTVIEKCASTRPNDWVSTVAFEDLPEENRARLGAFLSEELLKR